VNRLSSPGKGKENKTRERAKKGDRVSLSPQSPLALRAAYPLPEPVNRLKGVRKRGFQTFLFPYL